MNNLSYTSYSTPVVAHSTPVLAISHAETASANLPENISISHEPIRPAVVLSNNEKMPHEQLSFSNYQPIAHSTILPVHQLLF